MESSEIANITIHLVVAIPKQPTSSSQVLTISQSHNHNKLYNYMLQVSKYHQKLMMSRCLPVLPIHRISQDIFPEGSHIPGLLMSLGIPWPQDLGSLSKDLLTQFVHAWDTGMRYGSTKCHELFTRSCWGPNGHHSCIVQQNLGTGVLKKDTVPTKWLNLCK